MKVLPGGVWFFGGEMDEETEIVIPHCGGEIDDVHE
jgi:hypothetical protein